MKVTCTESKSVINQFVNNSANNTHTFKNKMKLHLQLPFCLLIKMTCMSFANVKMNLMSQTHKNMHKTKLAFTLCKRTLTVVVNCVKE